MTKAMIQGTQPIAIEIANNGATKLTQGENVHHISADCIRFYVRHLAAKIAREDWLYVGMGRTTAGSYWFCMGPNVSPIFRDPGGEVVSGSTITPIRFERSQAECLAMFAENMLGECLVGPCKDAGPKLPDLRKFADLAKTR